MRFKCRIIDLLFCNTRIWIIIYDVSRLNQMELEELSKNQDGVKDGGFSTASH